MLDSGKIGAKHKATLNGSKYPLVGFKGLNLKIYVCNAVIKPENNHLDKLCGFLLSYSNGSCLGRIFMDMPMIIFQKNFVSRKLF